MATKKSFTTTPCVPLTEIARRRGVSDNAVEAAAVRLGIRIDRSPTSRKRVTPIEADRIADEFQDQA